jgi:hypothetical protein
VGNPDFQNRTLYQLQRNDLRLNMTHIVGQLRQTSSWIKLEESPIDDPSSWGNQEIRDP